MRAVVLIPAGDHIPDFCQRFIIISSGISLYIADSCFHRLVILRPRRIVIQPSLPVSVITAMVCPVRKRPEGYPGFDFSGGYPRIIAGNPVHQLIDGLFCHSKPVLAAISVTDPNLLSGAVVMPSDPASGSAWEIIKPDTASAFKTGIVIHQTQRKSSFVIIVIGIDTGRILIYDIRITSLFPGSPA